MKQFTASGKVYKAYQLSDRTAVYTSSGGGWKLTIGLPTEWVVSDEYLNLVVVKDAALQELIDELTAPST